MTEDAAHFAREAKSLQYTLKESLKTKDPWDKETDFTRKQLRRNCLRLLLLHPYALESKDAENQLWMQTSYAFISVYKQRIAVLDRAIYNTHRQQQHQQAQGQGQGPPQQQGRGNGGHGVVEYRKLLQRFRQFLADEEKFWMQLIVRIRRIFQLDDVRHILADVGLPPDEPPVDNGPPRRNHFQFPSDADIAAAAPSLTPSTREQREGRMAILSKALVCLGDIERYREQYNEAGGRPRAGHEDGPPAIGANGHQKNGRGKKGGAAPTSEAQLINIPRLRNYEKARQCYQYARILLPQDGNPAHQMAILASYEKDAFRSLVHYYRALCVRTPYDTAAENLGTVLSKTMEQWKARGAKRDKEREKEQARGEVASMAPRLRVEAFRERLMVLHALWRMSPEDAEAMSPKLAQKLADDFKALVSERILTLDIILNAVVLGQGALWKHRMFRTASTNGHKKGPPPASSAAVESAIAGHVLLMHRMLLEVGIVQIAEGPPEDAGEHDLAQRITAAFRRTLPALRIASKWLRANLRYVTQSFQQAVNDAASEAPGKSKVRDRRRGSERRSSNTSSAHSIPGISEYWRAYAQFSTALSRSFPIDELPKLLTTLEEDVEMAGFLPLKKFVPGEVVGSMPPSKNGAKEARTSVFQSLLPEVHPNEEQLMRIADLLADAQAIAKDELSPLTFVDGAMSVKGLSQTPPQNQQVVPSPQRPVVRNEPLAPQSSPSLRSRMSYQPQPLEVEEDNMTDVTRTEDDPVEAAFREVLGADVCEEDEDEIVWNLGFDTSRDSMKVMPVPLPVSPPQHQPLVASPMISNLSPRCPGSMSPLFSAKQSTATAPATTISTSATTAQDILANVLHRSPPKPDLARSLHTRQASAPQSHMLFGTSPLVGGPSIWSSNESAGLNFHGAAGTTNGPSYPSFHQQSQIQGLPSSTYPAQASLGLVQESSALAPAYYYNSPLLGGHQRVQSLSLTHSHLPSSLSQTQTQMSDPFGSYPALTEQAPIAYNTGVPGAYADPIYPRKLDSSYLRQDAPGMHDLSVPYHLDPRQSGHGNAFPPPLSSMAQLWKNAG